MKLGTYTFKEFQAEYPDDEACLRKLMEVRYGGTEIVCPGCGEQSKFHPLSKRKAFTCQLCGHHIYPCADTIFHKSSTNLTKWFFAMYLMTTTRHGVAAKELERQIGCTYKTAWRMAHELRKLMAEADYQGPLGGVIEADETYLGGKNKPGKRGRGASGKTAVFGMVEREGRVRAEPVADVKKATLQPKIIENVEPDSIVITDEFKSYDGLEERGKLTHYRVNHGLKEYSFEGVHVNTLEGYWSRLKNSIRGTHVHISDKHAPKYICEFAFRYNMRKQPAAMFATLIASL
jgi:transposase